MNKEYDYILREIREARENQSTFLVEGGAKEYAEYRHICGVIRGLTLAESAIIDLVRKMEKDDE